MSATAGFDPLLWMGLVALAACLGAIAARAAGWPAAAGALWAGLLVGWAAAAGVANPPRGAPVWEFPGLLATAWLCLLAGAEMVAGRPRRAEHERPLAGAAVTADCVLAAAWPAAMAAGLPGWAAFVAAACCVAGSPIVVVAVTAEVRARGSASSHALASGVVTSLAGLGILLSAMAFRDAVPAARIVAGGAAGVLGGAVILIPVSRFGTRAAILPCLILGCLMLCGAALRLAPAQASVVPMALAAGWMIARFASLPDRVLEVLRELAVPAAVAWAALVAVGPQGPLRLIAAPVAALLAARALGLFVAGRIVPNPLAGSGPSGVAAQLATPASMVMMPAAGLLAVDPKASILIPTLLCVTVASKAIGLVFLRRALAHAGEVPSQDDPNAWRERLR